MRMPDVNRRTLLKLLPAFYTAGAISAEKEAVEPWVPAMAEFHRSFKGTAGQVAQFGDSITYTMAFWKPFSWSDPDRFIPDDNFRNAPPPDAGVMSSKVPETTARARRRATIPAGGPLTFFWRCQKCSPRQNRRWPSS
jgi:hypothetical protein